MATMLENANVVAVGVYNNTIELEKEFRIILKKKNIFDKNVNNVRNRWAKVHLLFNSRSIRDNYREIILQDIEFAASKEVEQNLWKTVFYKVIEEHRQRIRKFLGAIEREDKSGNLQDLQKLCSSFRAFISSATTFYKDLIEQVQQKYHVNLDGCVHNRMVEGLDVGLNSETASMHYKAYQTCHKCYVYLGDLARYHRDIYGAREEEWTCAAEYYKKAIALLPDYGNPHNQLAVLSTYLDNELNAVYHYFRGLAVPHPFITVRDNLVVLFEKNRLKTQSFASLANVSTAAKMHKFCTYFVRLHGLMFTKTSLETFEALLKSTMQEFSSLLRENMIDTEMLMKLYIINIFAMYTAQNDIPGSTSNATKNNTITKYAVMLGIQLFSRSLPIYRHDKSSLGIIGVFIDFLLLQSHIFASPDYNKTKTWQSFGKQLTNLVNNITRNEGDQIWQETQLKYCEVVLKEEKELRAFLPLLEAYKRVDFSVSCKEEIANQKRISKVVHFAIHLGTLSHGGHQLLYYDEKSHLFSEKPIKGDLLHKKEAKKLEPKNLWIEKRFKGDDRDDENGSQEELFSSDNSPPLSNGNQITILQAHHEKPTTNGTPTSNGKYEQPPHSTTITHIGAYNSVQLNTDAHYIVKPQDIQHSNKEEVEDSMDEEVIVFKPGEGSKLSNSEQMNIKHHHSGTNSVIGSEREEKIAEQRRGSQEFNLFSNPIPFSSNPFLSNVNNNNNNGGDSNSFFSAPSFLPQRGEIIQRNETSNSMFNSDLTSPTQSNGRNFSPFGSANNSFFAFSEAKQTNDNTFWTPIHSNPSQSLFSNGAQQQTLMQFNGNSHSSPQGANPFLNNDVGQWQPQLTSPKSDNSNVPKPAPYFPFGQQVMKTKNPFIS